MRERELHFISLNFGEPVPSQVGVVITSDFELDAVDFPLLVTEDDVEAAVNRAVQVLRELHQYKEILIGVDPGRRPGMAIYGDGELLDTCVCITPENASERIWRAAESYAYNVIRIRIGHGDKTNRNRTLKGIEGLECIIEIVDESRTTREWDEPDILAAKRIALKPGEKAAGPFEVDPTPGEIKEVQNRSRKATGGKLTLTKELARRVAEGRLTLEQAIAEQNNRSR